MTFHPSFSATRREVLAGLSALTAASVGSIPATSKARTCKVHGRVLAADQQPGQARGLGGVMVSNGRDVTLTNASGGWELHAGPDDTIFVIKPRGWTYQERKGIPQVSMRRPGEGTSPLDFYFRPQQEHDTFEVALLADSQAANATELGYVDFEMARCFSRHDFAFAINHGDVMGDDLSLMVPYKKILERTGLLWHHCPGNHDMDLASTSNDGAFDTWKRQIGPAYYAFQYANATFILLNNVEYLGAGAAPVDGRLYRGRIGDEQLAFVRNVLTHVSKDSLVVVCVHIPLVSFENPNAPGDNTCDCRELMALLSDFPHTVSFAGHSHTTEHHYLGADHGVGGDTLHHHHVLTAFCGSWWSGPLNSDNIPVSDSRDGSPRGYHVLRIEGISYRTRFIPVGNGNMEAARLGVEASRHPAAASSERLMTVDVFDGGPKTQIHCRLPGSAESMVMMRAAICDPHIVETFARYRPLLKPWVSASPSSHMWTASVPAEARGECVLEIINEYGVEQKLVAQI